MLTAPILELDELVKRGMNKCIFKQESGKLQDLKVLLQPQEQCNMNCSYCFDKDMQLYFTEKNKKPLMDIETFERQIEFLVNSQEHVSLTFHGGEPLLMGIEWFEKQFKIIEKHKDVIEDISIQTNLTLLTDEFIELFDKYNVHISTSFDGLTNEQTRSHTVEIIKNIKKLYQYYNGKKNIPILLIVNETNYDKLVDNYYYFKYVLPEVSDIGYNNVFISGRSNFLDYKKQSIYLKEYEKLFRIILDDEEQKPTIRNFYEFPIFLMGNEGYLCSFKGDCSVTFLGIFPDGSLTICDRFPVNDEEYIYGSIFEYNSFIEVMIKSENYKKVLLGQIERRRYCRDVKKCKIYQFCHGGCLSNGIFQGDITKPQSDVECYIRHGEVNTIIKVLNEIDIQNIKNKVLQKKFLKAGLRNKKVIIEQFRELIKNKGGLFDGEVIE